MDNRILHKQLSWVNSMPANAVVAGATRGPLLLTRISFNSSMDE